MRCTAGAVGVHDVELREAGASADPGDLRAGARVEDGRNVWATEAGDAAGETLPLASEIQISGSPVREEE